MRNGANCGAVMYGAGKEDIEKLLDYYDYDFISVDGQHSPKQNEDYLTEFSEAFAKFR